MKPGYLFGAALATTVLLTLLHTSSPRSPRGNSGATAAEPSVHAKVSPTNASHAQSVPPNSSTRALSKMADSVWNRLRVSNIIDTQTRTADDGLMHRSKLVRTAGKYPFVIFDGIVPANDSSANDATLRRQTAKAADHILVARQNSISDSAFRARVESAGYSVVQQLCADGPYIVGLRKATLSACDDALLALKNDGAIAYAEPDYLVFSADVGSASRAVELHDGVLVDPLSASAIETEPKGTVAVFDAATMEAATQERLLSLPAGTRLITFDSPTFLGGPGGYNPYMEEQNFRISTDRGVYVQGADHDGFPNNGTYYARSITGETNFTVQHREGLPFKAVSLDISEYSTYFATPTIIDLVGYRVDGTTVSQRFITDGVMDGTGPLVDFETVFFNSGFTNLSKLMIFGMPFCVDNIAVIVDGQETTPPAPPTPPLFYDVSWDGPNHIVNRVCAVSGPYAPTTVNFGTPTVRSQVGSMVGPVLELKGSDYQQFQFNLKQKASFYRFDFDAYIDLQSDFTVLLDRPTVFRIDFHPDGTITSWAPFFDNIVVGRYAARQVTHFTINVDTVKTEWEFLINGQSSYKGLFPLDTGEDLEDVRFHESGSTNGSVGLDNIRVYCYGTNTASLIGPRLSVLPTSLIFPATAIGSTKSGWWLVLNNKGTQTLTVQSATSDNGQFPLGGQFPMTILPGGFSLVPVSFSPQTTGAISGKITFTSNDTYTNSVVVPVSGVGTGVPQISVNPTNLLVTMLANSTGTRVFTISNLGLAELSWNLALKGGAAATNGGSGGPVTPNDTLFNNLWAMRAPQPGIGGIDAVNAWSITTGSSTNIIAVIDTGVDISHADLQGNLWVNTNEIPGNGIDDDHNGLVDDVYGWNFAANTNSPFDDNGHGTHVAGTIAARGNNSVGVSGVCWSARIMALKFLDSSGAGYTSDAVSAIDYATRMGARISNNSWGGGGGSQALRDAIERAGNSGALFVAAAGNNNANDDDNPHYPASYNLDNIVAVTASDETDSLAYFGNYGAASVHIAAPGADILSLRPGGMYGYASGSSMAAPHVAGVAGLLLAHNSTLNPTQLKQLMLLSADSLATFGGRVASGRLNAYRALTATLPQWIQLPVLAGTVPARQVVQVPLTLDTRALVSGSYTQLLAITSNDPLKPSVDLPVFLKVIGRNHYNEWLVGSFTTNNMLLNSAESTVWNDTADPDGDGLANLAEYVMGTDAAKVDTANRPTVLDVAGEKVFQLVIRDAATDAGYRIEWSSDINAAAWRSDNLSVVEDTTVGVPQGCRRIRVKITGTTFPTAFFRVVAFRN